MTLRPVVRIRSPERPASARALNTFGACARDSMTILDRGGAEDLFGDRDLLFYRNGRTERLQALLATAADVRLTDSFADPCRR